MYDTILVSEKHPDCSDLKIFYKRFKNPKIGLNQKFKTKISKNKTWQKFHTKKNLVPSITSVKFLTFSVGKNADCHMPPSIPQGA